MPGDFHQDLTCSICLDLFTEPVLLACEHCFCLQCIASFWQSQERVPSCPECRAPCLDRKCTPSRLLKSLSQKAQQVQQEKTDGRETEKKEGGNVKADWKLCCQEHGASMGLFCLTNQAPVCYRCVDSPAHTGHTFSSLHNGAQKCKEKLAQWLESLEVLIEKLEGRQRCQEGQVVSFRDSALSLRMNIEAKFSELQKFLNQRKEVMLAQLEKEEKDAHNDMETHLCQIQERLNYAMDLRSQDFQPFLNTMTEENEDNDDSLAVVHKELCLGRFKGPVQHLAGAALCSAFKGLEPVQLDPNTSHPIFVIYQEGTCVIARRKLQKFCNNPERFENYPMVLGKSGFCSGEHYWEIETKDAADWAIGVATESIERKVRVQDTKDKVWAVQLPIAKDISPEDRTVGQRLGVNLDYDKGQVSFYNAKTNTHLYTHRAQFKEKVYPFFWKVTEDTEKIVSLKICHN